LKVLEEIEMEKKNEANIWRACGACPQVDHDEDWQSDFSCNLAGKPAIGEKLPNQKSVAAHAESRLSRLSAPSILLRGYP